MAVAEAVLNASELRAILDLCRAARDQLGPGGSFRARVLLDMLLLEPGKELERLSQGTIK